MPAESHITPRGLSRIQAASYVGIGTTFFDLKVAEGILPKPFKMGNRSLWDRYLLDAYFDSLDTSVQPLEINPWEN